MSRIGIFLLAILLVAIPASNTYAYIGPGVGIGVIGTVLALFATMLLAIVGFVWYPIKRLRAWLRRKEPERPDEAE